MMAMTADTCQTIRVLIIDDHPVIRRGLKSLLAGHADLTVVGQAGDGAEVLPWLASHVVDVILLADQVKGQSGIEIARCVRRSYPEIKIIILTTFDDESYFHGALEAGVDGYLLKSVAHENLSDAIRAVMRGEQAPTTESRPAPRPYDGAVFEDGAPVV